MTDEEKKTIEYFKETYWYFGEEEIKANVDILLSLIEKQQKEIEILTEEIEILTVESTEWESKIYELQDEICELHNINEEEIEDLKVQHILEIQKKDKIIDLMCEQLAGLAIFDVKADETIILMDKEEVKQYFEKEAENGD